MAFSDTRARDARLSGVRPSLSGDDLDALSDAELETLLFADADELDDDGFWNLPTIAGLSMVGAGTAYVLQQMGVLDGLGLETVIGFLPLVAGALIVLIGFGVLSGRRSSSARPSTKRKKRLTRSKSNRKLMGVCGGLADYFGIDPTPVRLAFIVGLLASGGPPMGIAYLLLAYVLPKPPKLSAEERLRIIRES